MKMRLNRIWPKDLTYAIFLESWVFEDVKYDIPMCEYHSTRPQPIQLVPTMQKKLFTLSFQPKFLSHSAPYLEHPKNDQKRTHIGQKWHKEWCYHTFVKEWMKALDKTRILAPSDYFYHFSFPRYGRLKSKILCERYSHCIFSSCSINLTKSRYTWSLKQQCKFTTENS